MDAELAQILDEHDRGVKQSGLGREGGFDGVHEFLQTKYIGVEI